MQHRQLKELDGNELVAQSQALLLPVRYWCEP